MRIHGLKMVQSPAKSPDIEDSKNFVGWEYGPGLAIVMTPSTRLLIPSRQPRAEFLPAFTF
jgi:hypothetical protein